MPVPYTPLAVANRFIAVHSGCEGIEHMKLQKLVYYSYGWWLTYRGLDGLRLTTEGPEIWKHGPVFSSLYAILKVFGRMPITEEQSVAPFSEPDRIERDNDVSRLVDWIWKRYGHLSSFALSAMTHQVGTSWHRTAMENNFSVPFSTKISDEYIFEEFSTLKNLEISNSCGGEADARGEQITA